MLICMYLVNAQQGNDGISEWIYQFQQKLRETIIAWFPFANLNTKYASDKAAQIAYKTLIMSEYVKNCGIEDEIIDFIQMTKWFHRAHSGELYWDY